MPTKLVSEHRKLSLEVGLGCFVSLLYRDNEDLEFPFGTYHTYGESAEGQTNIPHYH